MWDLAISWKKLLKYLIKNWAKLVRQKWSHCFIVYKWKTTIIPLHSNEDLPKWTVRKIMKDLELSLEDIKKAR